MRRRTPQLAAQRLEVATPKSQAAAGAFVAGAMAEAFGQCPPAQSRRWWKRDAGQRLCGLHFGRCPTHPR
eukprot:9925195-Alexandrium_andersonii.AAC.1